ncbi:MAG: hypothetical protein ACRYG4_09185 [Janthinobacterium lividum]
MIDDNPDGDDRAWGDLNLLEKLASYYRPFDNVDGFALDLDIIAFDRELAGQLAGYHDIFDWMEASADDTEERIFGIARDAARNGLLMPPTVSLVFCALVDWLERDEDNLARRYNIADWFRQELRDYDRLKDKKDTGEKLTNAERARLRKATLAIGADPDPSGRPKKQQK